MSGNQNTNNVAVPMEAFDKLITSLEKVQNLADNVAIAHTKLEMLQSDVAEIKNGVSELKKELKLEINKIDDVVRVGNGQPSVIYRLNDIENKLKNGDVKLKERVTILEQESEQQEKNGKKWMAIWGTLVTAISGTIAAMF